MNKGLTIAIIAVLGIGGVFLLTQDNDSSMATQDEMNTDAAMQNEDMNDGMDMENDGASEDVGVMVGGAMMVPNLDIVDNAVNADNVRTLVAAVVAADLEETLKGEGPFTVFAPTNDAFDALPDGTVATLLLPENKADLANVLTYHVVAGSYTSADLMDGMTLTTVQGDVITIGKTDGEVTINGSAMVETADVISSNGVTHVIDAVLLPTEA